MADDAQARPAGSEMGQGPDPGFRRGDSSAGRGAFDPSSTPKDLKVRIKEQQLVIAWNDGTRSEFALAELRRRCPCASCRTQREGEEQNPLKVLKFDPTGVRVVDARLVGNYAIQLVWSDGHDTGIFDFRFLRSMAQE